MRRTLLSLAILTFAVWGNTNELDQPDRVPLPQTNESIVLRVDQRTNQVAYLKFSGQVKDDQTAKAVADQGHFTGLTDLNAKKATGSNFSTSAVVELK